MMTLWFTHFANHNILWTHKCEC